MACSKAHKLHVSDTPLNNASVVVTHVTAQGFCEGRLRRSLVSQQKVSELPNLDTRGRDRSQTRNTGRPRDAISIQHLRKWQQQVSWIQFPESQEWWVKPRRRCQLIRRATCQEHPEYYCQPVEHRSNGTRWKHQ